ncbi:MAG TPA: bifunctional [glutamine synthetase] adenylyltransferase/[glutamine synthetase]-adenylyl-L-tyrosine phosphorylase, partial [Rhodopseudomonas sp.]
MTLSATAADHIELAGRFAAGPRLFAPEDAARRLAGWLGDLDAALAEAIAAIIQRCPKTKILLQSIAEASPYLFDLIRIDPARLLRLLRCDPDLRLAELIEGGRAAVAAAASEAEAMQALRRMKSEAALLIALCDIGDVWPVMRITQALTDLAVASVQCALRFLLRQEAARGRLKPPCADRPEEGSGLVVLAMGKMGAGELNYSSDIDLIVFFDLAAPTVAPDFEPQPFFVRVTQGLARLLNSRTADGYVFRVDLRLRPDPASTPVAISTASALDY